MKRIYALISLLFVGVMSFAQVRKADVKIEIIAPQPGTIIVGEIPTTLKVRISNLGPDTLGYGDVFHNTSRLSTFVFDVDSVMLESTFPKGSYIDYALHPINLSGGPAGEYDLCITASFTGENLTDTNMSNNAPCIKVKYDPNVSIGDMPEEEALVSIFPNPAVNEVRVTYTASESSEAILKIYDITGKVVLVNGYESQIGENAQKVDVSTLAEGVYILELINGEAISRKQLIVK